MRGQYSVMWSWSLMTNERPIDQRSLSTTSGHRTINAIWGNGTRMLLVCKYRRCDTWQCGNFLNLPYMANFYDLWYMSCPYHWFNIFLRPNSIDIFFNLNQRMANSNSKVFALFHCSQSQVKMYIFQGFFYFCSVFKAINSILFTSVIMKSRD